MSDPFHDALVSGTERGAGSALCKPQAAGTVMPALLGGRRPNFHHWAEAAGAT